MAYKLYALVTLVTFSLVFLHNANRSPGFLAASALPKVLGSQQVGTTPSTVAIAMGQQHQEPHKLQLLQGHPLIQMPSFQVRTESSCVTPESPQFHLSNVATLVMLVPFIIWWKLASIWNLHAGPQAMLAASGNTGRSYGISRSSDDKMDEAYYQSDPYYGGDDSDEESDPEFEKFSRTLENDTTYQPDEEDLFIRQKIKEKMAAEAAKAAEAAASTNPDTMTENEIADEIRFLQSLEYNQKPRGFGNVKTWSDYYGYGFIEPNCQGPDVFVHATDLHSDPASGYRDLAVGELVYYDIVLDAEGRARATNVTGPDGAYVEGRRSGGIVLDEEDVKPVVAPKKKGVIRDFTESKYWSTETVPLTEIMDSERVPDAPESKVKWWEN